MSIRLRVTATRVYEADPSWYEGCSTPEEMAAVDLAGDPFAMLDHEDTKIAVTVEKNEP